MAFLVRLALLIVALFMLFSMTHYEHHPSEVQTSQFVKLNKLGHPMAAWQGPWSCVLDQETGLIWENKTDDETIHDGLWTFSWFQQNEGVLNGGDCYFEKERCDTDDLIRRMNQEKTCGIENWRLPSLEELKSIVFEHPKTGEAKIHGDYFPNTKRGDYWTDSSGIALEGVYSHLKKGAMAVDFIEGKPRAIPYRNAAFLRLVSDSSHKAFDDQDIVSHSTQ